MIVSTLPEMLAVFEQSRGAGVTISSPPYGAQNLGVSVWQSMVDEATIAYPEAKVTAILDCGDDAGLVQAALAQGIPHLCFSGPAETFQKLESIAASHHAVLYPQFCGDSLPTGAKSSIKGA